MMELLTKIALGGAVLLSLACFLISQKRFFKGLSDAYLRLTHLQRVLVLVAVAICTVYAQKPSTNDVSGVSGTNGVAGVSGTNDVNGTDGELSPPLTMFPLGGLAGDDGIQIDPADVARGYRLESVTTNPAISYMMPSGASVVDTWGLRGAYEDVVKADLGDFLFPIGRHLCDSLWAYTWGFARPQLKNTSNELVAVGSQMSAIPGVSCFWTAATTNDTRLLTWENFAVGRVTASSNVSSYVSAQIELFKSGDFIARSNDVESVYRRINPDDWDDDGKDNDDDEDPLCRVGTFFGPNQDMSFTSNLNAYCWVDIVVHQANASVVFSGDGVSNLPDPSFIAKAEETYRVKLLIGKTYQVRCMMPFEVVGKSDNDIEVWRDDDESLWINWPVNMWAMEGNGRTRNFRMVVSPAGIDGTFTWTRFCCSISGSGYVFTCSCRDGCSCGGCCAEGEFHYEGYSLPAYGGGCDCYYWDDPDEPHSDDPDEPLAVGVSAGFSKRVIFFEDEYANTTNDVVPWHSESLELCCIAYGGPNGGHLSVEVVGANNLIQYGGQSLPFEQNLAPYEVVSFTNMYRAAVESSKSEDIVMNATFDENETDWSESVIDKATAVRVEVEPRIRRDGAENRHLLGVREVVFIRQYPNIGTVEIDDQEWGRLSGDQFLCPILATQGGLQVRANGSCYSPNLQVIEPQGVVCHRGWTLQYGNHTNEAGWTGMKLDLIIEPETVCFSGLAMVEEDSDVGISSGYFANGQYSFPSSHGESQGAGTWYDISDDNFFFYDCPRIEEECPAPWYTGSIVWSIPIAWGPRGARSIARKVDNLPNAYEQLFAIDSQGNVRIDKFSQWVMRASNGTYSHSAGIILVQ